MQRCLQILFSCVNIEQIRLQHELQGVPEYLQPKYIQIVYYTGQQLQKILHFLEAEMITIRKLKI